MTYILGLALFALANSFVIIGFSFDSKARKEMYMLALLILSARRRVLQNIEDATSTIVIEEAESELLLSRLYMSSRHPSFAFSCAQKARLKLEAAIELSQQKI
ncbi:MAG: hypothetical protein Q8T09_03130 [Candidatus Melainabacteria bacterium]|nr:hypothetical protein [Candidatus Melainabacteria bacterium]